MRRKRKKKVRFLVNKYNSGENKGNEGDVEIRGIVIKDRPIPASFELKPRVYGGVEISPEETKLLELPPKYTVYSPIDMHEI